MGTIRDNLVFQVLATKVQYWWQPNTETAIDSPNDTKSANSGRLTQPRQVVVPIPFLGFDTPGDDVSEIFREPNTLDSCLVETETCHVLTKTHGNLLILNPFRDIWLHFFFNKLPGCFSESSMRIIVIRALPSLIPRRVSIRHQFSKQIRFRLSIQTSFLGSTAHLLSIFMQITDIKLLVVFVQNSFCMEVIEIFSDILASQVQ
mmetsp:Transcript_43427/g.49968  ORF Transcript_43427/g.49968 Transcript_43427/m.49968 type:complete len:204 (-) Transcript_43427:369-980(-)